MPAEINNLAKVNPRIALVKMFLFSFCAAFREIKNIRRVQRIKKNAGPTEGIKRLKSGNKTHSKNKHHGNHHGHQKL